MTPRIQRLLERALAHDVIPSPVRVEFDPEDETLPEPVRIGKRLAETIAAQNLASRPGSPEIVRVAAANSSDADKAAADFVCTGTNDEFVLNRAIELLTRGGTLKLADGDYYIDAFSSEGNTAVLFGYNKGRARAIDVVGGTVNKSYNTRFGVGIHVTASAMASAVGDGPFRVFGGTERKPEAPGADRSASFHAAAQTMKPRALDTTP